MTLKQWFSTGSDFVSQGYLVMSRDSTFFSSRILLPVPTPISSTLFHLANSFSSYKTESVSPPPRKSYPMKDKDSMLWYFCEVLLKYHNHVSLTTLTTLYCNCFYVSFSLNWAVTPTVTWEITGIEKPGILLNILCCIQKHPTTKNFLAQNVYCANVEKSCPKNTTNGADP